MSKPIERSSNTITIAEYWQNHLLDRYNYNPPCQRQSVWHLEQKVFLIDSILKNFPIPPIFLHSHIDVDTGKTRFDVIDGKQRLTTIKEFIENKFAISEEFSSDGLGDARLNDKLFRDLDTPDLSDFKKQFWRYVIPVEYMDTDDDNLVNNVFDRLNRNGMPLTAQELRNAKYHGTVFLQLATKLAGVEPWCGLLMNLETERMEDVEFVSELLFVILENDMFGALRNQIDDLYEKWLPQLDDVSDLKTQFMKLNDTMLELNLPYGRFKIGRVSHLYAIWNFCKHCQQNDIPIGSIREKLIAMYQEIRSDSVGLIAEKYGKSMRSNSKAKSSRVNRMDSMLEYCDLTSPDTPES